MNDSQEKKPVMNIFYKKNSKVNKKIYFKFQLYLRLGDSFTVNSEFLRKILQETEIPQIEKVRLNRKLKLLQERELSTGIRTYAYIKSVRRNDIVKIINLNPRIFGFYLRNEDKMNYIEEEFNLKIEEPVEFVMQFFGVRLSGFYLFKNFETLSKKSSLKNNKQASEKEILLDEIDYQLLNKRQFVKVRNEINSKSKTYRSPEAPQRGAMTVKTELLTDSEYLIYYPPHKQVKFKIGSEDPLKQKKQWQNVAQSLCRYNSNSSSLESLIQNMSKNEEDRKKVYSSKKRVNGNNYKKEERKMNSFSSKSKPLAKIRVICQEQTKNIKGVLDCDHAFCYDCIFIWSQNTPKCPICKISSKLLRKFNKARFIQSLELKSKKDQSKERFEIASENEQVDFECMKCHQMGEINNVLLCVRCQTRVCHMDCFANSNMGRPEYRWICYICSSLRMNYPLRDQLQKVRESNGKYYKE